MLTNIDVMEILNDSKLLKLANLECTNLGDKLILKNQNINENLLLFISIEKLSSSIPNTTLLLSLLHMLINILLSNNITQYN